MIILVAVMSAILIPDIYSQPESRGFLPYESNVPNDTILADSVPVYKEAMIDSVISFGKTYLGLNYKYGGTTEAGFDCSGYVSFLFSKFGYTFPHSSAGMATVGYEIDYKKARKGDFIYFKGRSTSSSRVGHVALIIAVDSLGVQMLHSNHRGVTIDRYPQMEYYRKRYLMCRRYDF